MIEITATGDTTLHTAGKYCPEDILVKVPAGGSSSGGSGVETWCGTIVCDAPGGFAMSSLEICYTDGNLDFHQFEANEGNSVSIEVVKNSIIYVDAAVSGRVNCVSVGSGATRVSANDFIFYVT